MSALTATVVIATLAVACSFIAMLFVTVTFRQALRDLVRDRSHDNERRDAQMSAMLDRFQAIRWEDLVAVRAYESVDQLGGFLSPEDQRHEAVTEVDDQIRWGPQSRLRQAQEQTESEQALLQEDFPDEYPVRGAES